MRNLYIMLALGCTTLPMTAQPMAPTDGQTASDPYLVEALKPAMPETSVIGLSMKAPEKAPFISDVIYDAEGREVIYSKESAGWYQFYSYSREYSADSQVGIVVYGDNGEVYLKNFLSQYFTDSYVKGELNDGKITVTLPQTVYYDPEMAGLGFNLQYLVYGDFTDSEGNERSTYLVSPDKNTVTFNILEDGSLEMEELASDELIGISYISTDGWAGYGDYSMKYQTFDLEHPVLPKDAVVEHWGFVAGTGDFGYEIGVAIDGNDVYIQGWERSLPDAVVKGTLTEDGKQVVFKNRQLVTTLWDAYFIFLMFVEDSPTTGRYQLSDPDRVWTLDFDAENKVMKTIEADADLKEVFNYYLEKVGYMTRFKDPTFKYQENYDGTPKNPYDLFFNTEYQDIWGYAEFKVNLPTVSTEDNALVYDDLYYRVYINDEPLIFYSDEYTGLPEDEIEYMPFGFESRGQIYILPVSNDHVATINYNIPIFPEGVETLGIETVYQHDNTVTYSDILTLDIKTGNVTSDVRAATMEKSVASVEYYNLTGCRVANPKDGIFIQKTLFDDGSVSSVKRRF